MSNKVTVKIKKLHPDAVIPQYAHKGDAGFDLVAVEDVIIGPGETKAVPLGLAFEIPEGYEMQIRPRSGVSGKTKLRIPNAPGTVDSCYRGEIKVLMENTREPRKSVSYVHTVSNIAGRALIIPETVRPKSYLVQKGDRIAQGVIQRVPQAQFIEVDELGDSERGEGGFGSSGVRQEHCQKRYCDDGVEIYIEDWDEERQCCKHFEHSMIPDSESWTEPKYCEHALFPGCGLR